MAIDREYWKSLHFTEKAPPHWRCPACHVGVLLLRKNSLHHDRTAESRDIEEELGGYDSQIDLEAFSGLLVCDNSRCLETVAIVGRVETEVDHQTEEVEHLFCPRFCFPPLHLFRISSKSPRAVSAELEMAFAEFWYDPAGAMNHLRKAVEFLLTALKIRRTKIDSKSGRKRRRGIKLHDRIEHLRTTKYAPLTDRLLAVKWLGNEGSHAANINQNDVLDACELLEAVIEKQFEGRERDLDQMSREINRRRKPRRR